jgi:hypothetical protein
VSAFDGDLPFFQLKLFYSHRYHHGTADTANDINTHHQDKLSMHNLVQTRYPINHLKHTPTQPPSSTRQRSSNDNTQQRHLWQHSSAKAAATGLKRRSSLLNCLLILRANLLQNNNNSSILIDTTP